MESVRRIYCDFDGTITTTDTVNAFFEQYADASWIESEKLWVEGKITSRENAIIQVGLLNEVSPDKLQHFIDNVELSDGFLDFLDLINSKGIEFVILSDGFDYFIEKVLEKNNIKNVKFFANRLVYKNNKFSIEFPYKNDSCKIGAGMCKCAKIKEDSYWYIGDGTSDLCVAKGAKKLFATKTLHRHCVTNNLKHLYFETFRDIIKFVE